MFFIHSFLFTADVTVDVNCVATPIEKDGEEYLELEYVKTKVSIQKRKPTLYSTDPLAAIKQLDSKLDDCMASFETRLSSTPTKAQPSLEQLAADFKQFKVCMKLAIELVRSQVTQVTAAVDDMENRSRRKFLIFRGVAEMDGENLVFKPLRL